MAIRFPDGTTLGPGGGGDPYPTGIPGLGRDTMGGDEPFGWEIGPSGFPVQVEVTADYVEPEMPYQGPSSPGFTPGPGAVYLAGPPATPELAEWGVSGEVVPESRVGYALEDAPVGGTGPVEWVAGVVTSLAIDWAMDTAEQKIFGGEDVSNGVDLYGHAGLVDGISVGGIGVPEPPPGMVAKQWKTKAFSHTVGEYWVYFFRLHDGRIMCYNAAKRSWKMWRPKKPIVLYRGKVTLSQAVKAQKMLDRLWKTVAKKTKALKLA